VVGEREEGHTGLKLLACHRREDTWELGKVVAQQDSGYFQNLPLKHSKTKLQSYLPSEAVCRTVLLLVH